MVQQEAEYERKLAFVVSQLNKSVGQPAPAPDSQLQDLQKELYFYKQRTRALKRELEAALQQQPQQQPSADVSAKRSSTAPSRRRAG